MSSTSAVEDTNFYFAEFEVEGSFGLDQDLNKEFKEQRDDALRQYIRSDEAVAKTDNGDWYFGRPYDDVNYDLGKFGKVYTDDPVTYDPELGDFVEVDQPNIDADYSMFLIHYELNLLIFNTTYRVRHRNFVKYFQEGFRNASPGSVDIDIEFLHNEDEVDSIVSNSNVLNAHFNLEPSNPHPDDAWEDLDDHIQKMLAEELDVDVDAIEGKSLNFDDEVLTQLLQMGDSPYGELRLTYNDNGTIKVYDSDEDEPVQKPEDKPDSIGALATIADDLISYAKAFL